MRLLPEYIKSEISWLPYVWLVWVLYFVVDPFLNHASAGRMAATLVATCIFLVLYFLAYWAIGKQKLWTIAGMALLGIIFTPQNWGASAFFIYAAATAGFVGETGLAVGIVLGLETIFGAIAWVFHAPLAAWIPIGILIQQPKNKVE